MKDIEYYIEDKILGITNYVLSKIIKPDISIDKVGQIDA